MSMDLTATPVVETEPGKVMPQALIELDFSTNGPLVSPATMNDGGGVSVTICSSSSCRNTPPTKD